MTHMDIDTFSVYPEVVRKDLQCWSLTPGGATGMNIKEEGYFVTAIEKALGVDQLKLITTGGDSFEAEREQWNDANNVLTVRPAWWWVMSATPTPTRNMTRPVSQFSPFRVMNWAVAAAAPAA